MSEVEHTPGPWEIAGQVDMSNGLPSGFLIVQKTPVSGFSGVAAALNRSANEQDEPCDETLANAKLIAAAPETKRQRDELLEACKEAADFLGCYNFGQTEAGKPVLEQILAAIAKST